MFKDRTEAGKRLANELSDYENRDDVIILGLARGGVPVAFEIAKEINVPMDVFLVRKLGVPSQKELAMGAIASGGIRILNDDVINMLRISDRAIDHVANEEQQELERREREYRGNRQKIDVKDRVSILVDDGLATGASMRAAVRALRQMEPAKIVIAVPVAAPDTCDAFKDKVDEIICLATPEPFYAIGAWYDNFSQTTDEEVRSILAEADKLIKSGAESN
jgi:predicted phosphoribosyltransferase